MKAIAWLVVAFALAAPAVAGAQQSPEGVVTLQRKGSIWSFKVTPEGRAKVLVGEKEVETDVPQRLYFAFALDEPRTSQFRGSTATFTVQANPASETVEFFKEGKTYADHPRDLASLQSESRDEVANLQRCMAELFFQFDLDFPGGTWEELAHLLRDRLGSAYELQLPDILKPFLPAKVEIEISGKTGRHARYPAIQAKSITLGSLHLLGPDPFIEGKSESTPRVVDTVEGNNKGITLVLEVRPSLSRWVLADRNSLQAGGDELEVAFFHLGSVSPPLGADDVVALFEMAWKARGGPLYAKVKYHPETKTLMVQGIPEEILAADKAFAKLTGRPAPVEQSANPFDAITQNLQKIAGLIEKQTMEKSKAKENDK